MGEWAAYATAQDGIVSRAQLAASGVSTTSIDRMVSRGELVRLAPAAFLVRGAPLTYRARLWVAVLVTDGVLGYLTAAELWGMIDTRPDRIEVAVPHQRRSYPPAWIVVRRASRDARAIQICGGLPTTSRIWTLCDVLPRLQPAEASALADRAIQRGWLTPAGLTRHLARNPGRHGNTALRVLADQLGDGAAAKSERLLHRILRSAGIRGWVANYPVWIHGELAGVADVAIVERRIALEVDGWAYHSDVVRFRRDRSKQNTLVAAGWTVLRFTWADLTERPGYVVTLVSRMIAA
jgi:very-short-patch-repair endonuclease